MNNQSVRVNFRCALAVGKFLSKTPGEKSNPCGLLDTIFDDEGVENHSKQQKNSDLTKIDELGYKIETRILNHLANSE